MGEMRGVVRAGGVERPVDDLDWTLSGAGPGRVGSFTFFMRDRDRDEAGRRADRELALRWGGRIAGGSPEEVDFEEDAGGGAAGVRFRLRVESVGSGTSGSTMVSGDIVGYTPPGGAAG